MTITSAVPSNLLVSKLQGALATLSDKLKNNSSASIPVAVNEAYVAISNYFKEIGTADFVPILVEHNDIPSAETYNRNLILAHNDIVRFYADLKNLTESYVTSYNYAQIISKDILEQANGLASIVVDLNILNNFDRGDTIVAGDDFNNLNYVDSSISLGSDQVELIPGGGGVTLTRSSSVDLLDTNTKVEIVPIAPTSQGNTVNTEATPGNIERFYEGNFYNFLGLARPEGGNFNFKTLTQVSPDTKSIDGTESILIDVGASTEAKSKARSVMFDKNPATFWECEYLFRTNDIVVPSTDVTDSNSDATQQIISVDVDQLNKIAKSLDRPNTDLVVDIIVTLPEIRTVNFVSINPILFSSEAYPEIVDISYANSTDGTFSTIPGWESIKFPKYLTPEANEFLTDSQQSAILAPSKAAYKGQGVFNFPPVEAKKMKVRLKVDSPVSNIYERTYALVNTTVKVTSTVTTTTTKRSLF